MKSKVMIISSVHRWDDTRIFHRQASSLAKEYDVELHAPASFAARELNGVKIIGLPKWEKRLDRMKIWMLLLKRVVASNAKVIHFHDPELIPLAFLVKLISTKKVIYDVHEHIVFDIEGKDWIPARLKPFVVYAFTLFEKICVPKFDAVIYTTPMVGKRYIERSKEAVSIENYSKLGTFSKMVADVGKNAGTVIYLGRVLSVRGVDQVIRSFEHVVTKVRDAKFVIVGDIVPPKYEETLRAQADALGLGKHIDFVGFVDHLETLRYLEQASCGIVVFRPEKINQACLPNKLFEYMAAGLPVIASNFDLYRQVIEGSQCGITVDPDNIEMIADAIVYMLSNADVRTRMGVNAKKAVESEYNWEQEEVKLFRLYRHLLAQESRP